MAHGTATKDSENDGIEFLNDSTNDEEANSGSGNRLKEEFEDITAIAKGAFGTVYKAKKKLDGAYYAVKQVRVPTNKEKELREVKLHQRLYHENIVRYYDAWIGGTFQQMQVTAKEDDEGASEISESTESDQDTGSSDVEATSKVCTPNDRSRCEYLYIQTEYCEMGTLRDCIEKDLYKDEHRMWQYFREITEGLSYIHGQDVIHRDLKPDNIFLTSKLNIKIGDFGLATLEPSFSDQSTASDVGTGLYMAPEMRKPYMMFNKRKSKKVDIYSLGIIFFEMNYRSCETLFELSEVVTKHLRPKEITLPDDFLNGMPGTPQEKILRLLLKEDPDLRPSADEILSSEVLPPPPHEEKENGEIISKVVANPQCRLYKRLVQELFKQPEYTEQELDINDALQALNLKYCRKQETVKRICGQILQNHGAQPLTVPLLLPNLAPYDDNESAVRIMDCTGKIVMLAPDLRIPFVRYISQKNISSLKRYTIDRVYCKAENNGIHPKERLECAFDIISRTAPAALLPTPQAPQSLDPTEHPDHQQSPLTALHSTRDKLPPLTPTQTDDVEVVHAATQILEQFPVLTKHGYTCHLNHVLLTQAVLLSGGVPRERLNEAISVLSVTEFNKDNKMEDDDYCKILSTAIRGMHLNAHIIDLFKLEGSLEDISVQIERVMDEQREACGLARSGINELQLIIKLLKIQVPKLTCHVSLGLLTPARYSSGLIFQLTSATALINPEKATTVIAVGYRYDDLLQRFREPRRKNDIIRGAGVSIYIDVIAKSLAPENRVELRVEQHGCSSNINTNSLVDFDDNKGVISAISKSTDNVKSSTGESGILLDSTMSDKVCSEFKQPRYSWDISVHEDRIFVAAYAAGMYEYTFDGEEKSGWQAPSWMTRPNDNSNNPSDTVYTVHTMRDGRVLVGLQKSRSVIVLRRQQLPASAEYKDRGEDQIKWVEESCIALDARPWRLSSDGINRIAVIHASEDPKIRPATKYTVALLSNESMVTHGLSFAIASVAVCESMLFFVSLRDNIPGIKKQQRSVVMAYNHNRSLRWTKEIEDNTYDVACDSLGCKVYLALGGDSRCVIALDGGNGSILARVLPRSRDAPLRLSVSDDFLAVLRYDRKTVGVYNIK